MILIMKIFSYHIYLKLPIIFIVNEIFSNQISSVKFGTLEIIDN